MVVVPEAQIVIDEVDLAGTHVDGGLDNLFEQEIAHAEHGRHLLVGRI